MIIIAEAPECLLHPSPAASSRINNSVPGRFAEFETELGAGPNTSPVLIPDDGLGTEKLICQLLNVNPSKSRPGCSKSFQFTRRPTGAEMSPAFAVPELPLNDRPKSGRYLSRRFFAASWRKLIFAFCAVA